MKHIFSFITFSLALCGLSFADNDPSGFGGCAFVIKNQSKKFTFEERHAAATISNLVILPCSSGEWYPDDQLAKKYCGANRADILYTHPRNYSSTCKGLTGKITLSFLDKNGIRQQCTSKIGFPACATKTGNPAVDICELIFPKDFEGNCLKEK